MLCVFYGGVPAGVASLEGSDVLDGKCVTSEGFPRLCVQHVCHCMIFFSRVSVTETEPVLSVNQRESQLPEQTEQHIVIRNKGEI